MVCLGFVGLFAGRAAASQYGFVYALQQLDGGTNQIHGFRFDPTTYQLTPLPGFPMSSGGTGGPGLLSEQLAYADGRLFVLNNGSDTLTAFSVNRTTGALTAMPFGPIALGAANWNCVAVHPAGSPVVAGNSSGALASFVVTDTTATAAAGSPFASGAGPFSCRFSERGTYVYTGGNTGNTIAGFSVNPTSGVLTALAGSPFDAGAPNPVALATDATGRLFSAMLSTAHVRAYSTSFGVPTAVSGNPFASGLITGIHGLVHPAGFYMVADRTGNVVGSYQIAGTGAATTLTPVFGSPFLSAGLFTNALALTADGAYLFAANGTSRNISVFQVNQSNGIPSFMGIQLNNTLGASGSVSGLVFAESEAGFVYTLQQINGAPNQIYGFRINPSTGALIPLAGFPVSSGGNGSTDHYSEQIAYGNGRLYVLNGGSDTLTAFKVNRTTGALTPLAFNPVPLGPDFPSCVAVHPGPSPVVVVGLNSHLASFVSGASFSPAAGSPFPTGTASAYSCHFSSDGNYVYAGGNSGTRFAGFAVNSGNGVLTPLAGSPYDSGAISPASYATDSSGRLFMTNVLNPAQLRVFTTSAGVPAAVSGNPFASPHTTVTHGVHHPSGFYIVADRANNVGVYRVDGSGAATTLTAVSGSPFASGGSYTDAVTLTDDGRFLIAGNGLSGNLTVFRVNPASGFLTSVGTQPAGTLGASGLGTGVTFAPAAPAFIDEPLIAASGVIKAVHITELRTRINAVRARYGMAPYSYTNPTLAAGGTVIQAAHVSELRAALGEIYAATGIAPPSYTDASLTNGVTVVKAVHITELRAAVIAVE